MKTVYSIYDKKLASYGNPVLASHVGEITRSIERVLQDDKSDLAKWPGEFQIVKLGQYDQATGSLVPAPVEVVFEVAALVRPIPRTPPSTFVSPDDAREARKDAAMQRMSDADVQREKGGV